MFNRLILTRLVLIVVARGLGEPIVAQALRLLRLRHLVLWGTYRPCAGLLPLQISLALAQRCGLQMEVSSHSDCYVVQMIGIKN